VRVIFAGTPPFAAAALDALADAGHDIALVLTQPDRPAGRGMKLAQSAVKRAALARGLRVIQPHSLKAPEAQAELAAVGADVMVVAAYGLILPQAVLDIPRLGCLNIHASLLPRWRGAAPIQRAILAGDTETGVTIMQMDAGLDTGAMLMKSVVPIRATDTAASLHDALAAAGADAIVAALASHATLVPEAQDERSATYAAKLGREEARIDWTRPAERLAREVRAYDPVPGAWTLLDGAPLKIWAADVVAAAGGPGEVLRAEGGELWIACGRDAIAVRELQPAGARRMTAAAFLAGRPLPPGTRLGH
jgi:methionyl-tRNA formyltransferase